MGTSAKSALDASKKQHPAGYAINKIAGTLTAVERSKLQSGEGFVKVPHEELCRQRINAYQFLM